MSEHAQSYGQSARDLPRLPVCGYSPVPSDPTVPLCNAPAVLHVLPEDRGTEAAWTIMACSTHARLAQAGALDSHPWTTACLGERRRWVRGTAWRMSGCAVPAVRAAS